MRVQIRALIVSSATAILILASSVGSAACTAGSSNETPPSPLTGLLTELRVSPEGEVTSFTITADDGRAWELEYSPESANLSVPAVHLQLHVEQGLPVKVSFRRFGDKFIAYLIDDG